MKTRRSRSRKSVAINNSRWLAYATAGAASAFTAVDSTDASIHYSGFINEWVGRNHQMQFQLDRPGDSIGLKHYMIFSGGYGGTARFGAFGLAGAAFAGTYQPCSDNTVGAFVSNLKRGAVISHQQFLVRQSGLIWGSWPITCSQNHGQFGENQAGYAGFRFNNGHGDQYGWARVGLRGDLDHPVKLIDYAYGDVGDKIRVGQTSGGQDVTLESLGGLALGAAGLLAWRKRR